MSDISKNINHLRVARDLNQSQLAEKLNVTRQTISSWERGNSNPDVDMLLKLAEVLETDVNNLLYPQGSGGNRPIRPEPLSMKFILLSIVSYFILLVWGGAYVGIPMFRSICGGGIDEEFLYILYWGLILLVGYIAICVALITEYLAKAADQN